MAQPPHYEIDGAIYFITTRLEKESQFFTEEEAKIVEETLLELETKKELMVYAYVVMPNHVHVLCRPLGSGLSKAMQLLKGRSSRLINVLREAKACPTATDGIANGGRGDFGRPSNVWQKGFFDFTVLTERKFREKFNYIHYNPLRWGLAGNAEDYQYSSARHYKVKYGEVFY